jgi:short-subunit dehydrogenase
MAKLILITGVSSGIGRAFIERAGTDFRDDIVIGVSRGQISFPVPSNVRLEKFDIAERSKLAPFIERIVHTYGPIDVLINNAGNGMKGTVDSTSEQEMLQQMEINVFSTAEMMRAVIPSMKSNGRGKIINVSSLAAYIDYPTIGYYGASKAFIDKVSRVSAVELAPWNIKVSLFVPGAVKSNFGRNMTDSASYNSNEQRAIRTLWDERFTQLFKKASSSNDAALALTRLVHNGKTMGFITFRDKFSYRINEIIGPRMFFQWLMKWHMRDY